MTEEYWWLRAACRGKHETFDSEESISGKQHYPHLTEAQAICSVCPVAQQCGIAGRDELTGIWNGEAKGT